jgi:hypothetical protein
LRSTERLSSAHRTLLCLVWIVVQAFGPVSQDVRVHTSADIAELPVDTSDEFVREQMRPSASDELVEFDRTGRCDRPRTIGVRARGAGDEQVQSTG